MNPKMKNSAVTVMNGMRYPGDVSAADCLDSAAIEGFPRFLKYMSPGRPAIDCTQHYTE
jgi:hypothetical protein